MNKIKTYDHTNFWSRPCDHAHLSEIQTMKDWDEDKVNNEQRLATSRDWQLLINIDIINRNIKRLVYCSLPIRIVKSNVSRKLDLAYLNTAYTYSSTLTTFISQLIFSSLLLLFSILVMVAHVKWKILTAEVKIIHLRGTKLDR